jgi:hypothetical protein
VVTLEGAAQLELAVDDSVKATQAPGKTYLSLRVNR